MANTSTAPSARARRSASRTSAARSTVWTWNSTLKRAPGATRPFRAELLTTGLGFAGDTGFGCGATAPFATGGVTGAATRRGRPTGFAIGADLRGLACAMRSACQSASGGAAAGGAGASTGGGVEASTGGWAEASTGGGTEALMGGGAETSTGGGGAEA